MNIEFHLLICLLCVATEHPYSEFHTIFKLVYHTLYICIQVAHKSKHKSAQKKSTQNLQFSEEQYVHYKAHTTHELGVHDNRATSN